MRPSDASCISTTYQHCFRQWFVAGRKPWFEPMLKYCQLSLATNLSEILIGADAFSFKKMHLKMSSGQWRSLCLSLNVLKRCWHECHHGWLTHYVLQVAGNCICSRVTARPPVVSTAITHRAALFNGPHPPCGGHSKLFLPLEAVAKLWPL